MLRLKRQNSAAPVGIVLLTLALAGCNTVLAPPPAGFASSNVTPHGYALPEGTGCATKAARYRAVITNDVHIGQVNQKVSGTIFHEIDLADAACKAGQNDRAISMLRASEVRYGYPTTI